MTPDSTLMDNIGMLYQKLNVPYSALFELTYSCAFKCFHCYNTSTRKKELSTEEVYATLEQLAALGCLHLTLSGGEPLNRRDCIKIFERAQSLGFAWNLSTNASCITDEIADTLKQLHVLEVSTSIFSTKPETHDRITGVKGSLKNTLKGLSFLKNHHIRLRIKCLLMKCNLDQYQKIGELARSLGATCQFDTNLLPGGQNNTAILKQRLNNTQLQAVLANQEVFPIHDQPFSPHANNCSSVLESNQQITCSAGKSYLGINPYGDVFPCIHFPEPGGNIKSITLKEIWGSPVFQSARSMTLADTRECLHCSHNQYCARCPGLAHKEDGNLLAPSQWACKTAKITKALLNA